MVQHADIDHTGITGVGGALTVENEGTPLATAASTLDFVGAGVTASGTGAEKTITVPGSPTVAAQTATVATAQSTTSTSYTDLSTTGPAVTVTVNTIALVIVSCRQFQGAGDYSRMSFAASGANTISASDTRAVMGGEAADDAAHSRAMVLTGLTPGSTTFTAKYKSHDGGSVSFQDRDIAVIPLD